MTTFSVATR